MILSGEAGRVNSGETKSGSRLRGFSAGAPGEAESPGDAQSGRKTEGDAALLLFLHGFLGSSSDWNEVAANLRERPCFAPDLPGHGRAVNLPPKTYTMEGAANALLAALDERGVGRCVIVGYSMGGRLGLYFALRHPDRCAGLLLESTSPGLKTEEERAARRHADEEKARRLESGDFEEFLSDWYSQPLFASLTEREGSVGRLVERRLKNIPQELAKSLRGMGTGSQPSLWPELPALEVPTLAVTGELDGKFAGISREMAKTSPAVCSSVLEGAGHNVHLEAPKRFSALVERVLTGGHRDF